ncbi:signal peptide protein [Bacillus sp. TS-2]|nr:signal peptide protein [Bacillus sp. TS-2]
MNGKRWMALGAVAFLLMIAVISNIYSFARTTMEDIEGMGSMFSPTLEETVEIGTEPGKIVLMELNGIIQDTGSSGGIFAVDTYNHQQFLEHLEYASQDPQVEGIVIRVNTPGGGVVESAEIYDKILSAKEEYEIPVYISMANMAASGGYYIAAPATKIFASEQTITGSIGVIMESINIAGLAEQFGIEVNTIKSGEYKDIMSATREMTDDERDILQSIIDESYEEFVRIIAEGRQMDSEEVREIADGRIYTGNQAFELGLVDELGNTDDAIADLKEMIDADVSVVKYGGGSSFSDLFKLLAPNASSKPEHEMAAILDYISEQRTPTLKYLYSE